MINKGIKKLKNGLTIIYYEDKTKHNMVCELFIKYGGMNNQYLKDNKLIHVQDGMAHFLEHTLLEHSIYGNIINKFKTKGIISNGYTSFDKTCFFISTIRNFETNAIKLIKAINTPVFNETNVKKVKHAIIEEIREGEDNDYRNLDIITRECLYKNIDFLNNIGTIKDVNSITYEEAMDCYRAFYQPSNQVIVIFGRINADKVIKLIEQTYEELNIPKINISIPNFNEPNEVALKEKSITGDVDTNLTQISYKINFNNYNFTNFEKVRMTFYLRFFLESNFSETSKAYKKLIEEKISVNSIDTFVDILDNFFIIYVSTNTLEKEKFVDLIQNQIKNIYFSKEDFEIRKKQLLIDILLREESLSRSVDPYVDNILTFNYNEMDKIEDIENMTFEDYKEKISILDFSNYTINTIIKKGDQNGTN